MTIKAIYRSYGGENMKGRPDFYSKQLCLLSFVRAAERADVQIVFMNNGPIPEDRLRVMEVSGELLPIGPTDMRGSWRTMLREAASSPPEQVLWLGEDDYLYTPDALACFAVAVDQMPDVDYFLLYGSTERHSLYGAAQRKHEPPGWQPVTRTIEGHDWVRVYASTGTFGVRAGALTEDLGIFWLTMAPHRTMFRDLDMFLTLQGYEPHRWAELGRAAIGLSGATAWERLRHAALSPFLAATNLRSHRRPQRRRLLMAADPNLATHMERDLLSPGSDWGQVARETEEWARGRGLLSGTSVAG